MRASSAPSAAQLGWFDATDFGAVGNGIMNDSAAVQAAANAAAAAGGGTVYLPELHRLSTAINVPAASNHEDTIIFRGSGRGGILVDTPGVATITLTSFEIAKFIDLVLAPYNVAASSDATSVISSGSCLHTPVDSCHFIGLQTSLDIILGDYSGIDVRRSSFRGCGASRGVVTSFHSRVCSVDDTYFVDFGSWNGTGYNLRGACTAWVRIGNPITASPPYDSINSGTINVRRCGFDEGAQHALRAESGSSGAFIPRIDIEDCDHLIGVGASVYVDGCRTLVVDKMGWHNQSGSRKALDIYNVHRAELRHGDALNDAGSTTLLTADALCGTVYLYESDNITLASSASTTVLDVDGVRTIT